MKILVVDDHPLIQQALAHALPALHGAIDVIAAIDRDEALTALARHPDCALVLLDLTLPGAHGLDLLAQLRRDFPLLPVVVLSATHDRATVGAAMAAGAQGYIAKTSTPDELLDAVRTVLEGGRSVTSRVAALAPVVGGIAGEALGLTHRQADVLRLLLQGKPNKLICRDLQLSEGTVKVHVSAILKALNVRSRAQAIAELSRRGVVIDGAARAERH
ncbi:MAG TPA: response regulator transcription factor [Casimicrobiaceae bacterium]|jgi:DNA-binding NarL/FixJ family response regulator|nr:response regulator transcription factor [Casimicrobiaceae bacterium]